MFYLPLFFQTQKGRKGKKRPPIDRHAKEIQFSPNRRRKMLHLAQPLRSVKLTAKVQSGDEASGSNYRGTNGFGPRREHAVSK